jgi:uncharacterized SAM-binding protein YcdF (DUF218 family)
MFFIVSKLLAFIINPLVIVFILLIRVWRTKEEKKKRNRFSYALFLLYIFSNSFLLDECMRLWEYNSKDYVEYDKVYDYGVVLGGYSWYDYRMAKPQFMRSSDRLWQSLKLLNQGRIKKLLISGGSGSIDAPYDKEAIHIQEFLIQMGIPKEKIIIENESKNTYENALFTKKIMDSLNTGKDVLLITSAFHMRRSLAIFKKLDYKSVAPFSTDRYSGSRKFIFDHCFIPDIGALGGFNLLFHEMLGYAVYKVKGYL